MKGVDIMLENKKSFKEVVKEHKYQIIAGAACITTGVVSYLLFKEIKKNNSVNDVQETLQVIQAAMSEGMVQEAIATTTRKYNVRMDKIDHLTSKCKLKYDEQKKLEKAMAEAAVFKRRIEAYRKVESKYFIEE